MADVVHENSQAVLRTAADFADDATGLASLYATLEAGNRAALAAEGVDEPRWVATLDMRYRGQSYELAVPLAVPISPQNVAEAVQAFHALHATRYGYAMAGAAVEIVTLRVQGIGDGARPQFEYTAPGARMPAPPTWADSPSGFAPKRQAWWTSTRAHACSRAIASPAQPWSINLTPQLWLRRDGLRVWMAGTISGWNRLVSAARSASPVF